MKKILYVGAGAPWAGGGGGAGYLVRQGMFLRALAGLGELHLAMFDLPGNAGRPPFECELVPLRMVYKRSGEGWSKVARAWGDMVHHLPRMVRDVDVGRSSAPLRRYELSQFDAVVAYRVDFAFSSGVLGHPRLVLDVDDPEHLRWRKREEACGKRIDWRTERDLKKLRRFECDAVAGAAHAFVCQEKEREAFPGGNVSVVPNGVEVPLALARGEQRPRAVMMLGNFSAGAGSANDDALEWFVKKIWPLVRSRCADAVFQVVGRMSEEVRRELAGVEGVRAVGFVESLGEAFGGARMSVAPLRFGTGTRVKILDSFAYGCPVVSTTAGAEGLAVTAGKDVLIGDAAETFAGHCVRLLEDHEAAQTIGEAGRRLVMEKYDRLAVEAGLRKVIQEFLGSSVGIHDWDKVV